MLPFTGTVQHHRMQAAQIREYYPDQDMNGHLLEVLVLSTSFWFFFLLAHHHLIRTQPRVSLQCTMRWLVLVSNGLVHMVAAVSHIL
ncbi:hypothetical protein V8F06_006931 [Rhypophila decipiens]